MDVVSAVVGVSGVAGALGGVLLGGWLGERRDRFMLRASQERDARRERLDACIEYLANYRQFRGMVLTEDPQVDLPPGREPGREIAFIRNARDYSDASQAAMARLLLVEGDGSPIVVAAQRLTSAFSELAVARGKQGPGPLPDNILEKNRACERDFTRVVQQHLGRQNGAS